MFKSVQLLAEKTRVQPRVAAVALPPSPSAELLDAMRLPAAVRKRVDAAVQRKDITLAAGEATLCGVETAPALLVLGLGSENVEGLEGVRRAAAAMFRACERAELDSVRLYLPGARFLSASNDAVGRAIAEAVGVASFRFDDFRGAASHVEKATRSLRLALPAAVASGYAKAEGVAPGVTTARRLAATPPNVAHPQYLSDRCREMARKVGLHFHEIDAEEAERLGMGGLLAVGRAGSSPPRLLVLEHRGTAPRRAAMTSREPVLLVGKAVTFDTGGVSLKPTASMTGMKYDMCGGAAVIGAMEAVARLKLPTPVVGLVPCAENLVSQTAYRVDDILELCNGVTVEVTNTDAEGRLILADALAYGTRLYKPAAVIDLATLTGGVVTALGDSAAGLFVNDHELHRRLDIAADATGEKLWPLPLWNEHREKMRGTHADLRNSADRKATSAQGAAFLSFFVGEHAPTHMPTLPWAHLDIAGVATAEEPRGIFAKGPTGFGVRLLARYLQNLNP
ncbi:MAG: leucyl aminopeptidase family protein [Phycisphaeraceae bacterium]